MSQKKPPQTAFHRDEATLRVLAGDWTCDVCGFWEEGYEPLVIHDLRLVFQRPPASAPRAAQIKVCRLCYRSYHRSFAGSLGDWLEYRKAWVEKQRGLGWPRRRHFKKAS